MKDLNEKLIDKNDSIFIAGHNGMVGKSLHKTFLNNGYTNLLKIDKSKLDLRNECEVSEWFRKNTPKVVIIAAAKVGGILANSLYPVDFLLDNLKIQNNIIENSWKIGVKRLLFLGSSCIYPKYSRQPIKEEYLMSDELEPTNESYAIAKIAGIKLCNALRRQHNFDAFSLLPCNLYGPGDNYDLRNSHVIPALIRKLCDAKLTHKKRVICWGDGTPLREFLHCDDLADACEFFLKKKTKHTLINIGSGDERTIKDYSRFIMNKLGIKLKIVLNKNKPTGTPRKTLNTNLAKRYGWKSKINLDLGFDLTYHDFLKKNK